jgi:arabinofuranan 3-O-arabinosyltransferase
VPLFVHETGWYLGDTQFFFSWNPSQAFAALSSIWQRQTDLGGPIWYGAPVATALMAAVRGIGLEPWVAQRLWYSALLATGSVGTAYVARYFVPRRPTAALLAGLCFLASPFTIGYFYRSWLFLAAAFCPWLLLATLRGVTSRSHWRWAALACLMLAAALSNVPAVAFALVPAAAALLYLRCVEGVPWRSIAAWLARVAVFVIPASIPFLMASWLGAAGTQENLASTERLPAIAQSSTWSESLRGLGGWLLYWNPNGRLVLPYVGFYMTNWLGVLWSFVPILAAMAVVVFARGKARLFFGGLLLVAAAVMVGAYPLNASPPFGELWAVILRDVANAFAFRSVYKAGAALVLATAVLIGLGWAWFLERSPNRRARWAVASCAGVVLVATSYPIWSGGLLHIAQRLHGDVPTYWIAATRWLDQQHDDGRVLVAPDSLVTEYRWGSTADGDLFSSFMRRPVVLGGAFPASVDDAGDLTQALTNYLSSGHYTPGTLAPIARRLGISYLLIRNDLDWQAGGEPRPAALESLRHDPGLRRVAQFGRPGENTARGDDHSVLAARERKLAPVEIYRIRHSDGRPRAVSESPSLLVSGDGSAWPLLAQTGMLQNLGPVQYTGRLDNAALRDELNVGATAVVTDTNRRRPYTLGVSNETLTGAPSDEAKDLFARDGSQSIATYGDAESIEEIGPSRFAATGVTHEASSAFDGDPDSAWLTGLGTRPLGELLSVRLRRPHVVSSIQIQGASGPSIRNIRRVQISFDKGTANTVKLRSDGTGTLTLKPRPVRLLNFRVLDADPGNGAYGFSEIRVPGLNLRRELQVPNDLAVAAQRSETVSRALERAPLVFALSLRRARGNDSEPTLRRRLNVPVTRAFRGEGTLTVTDDTSDAAAAQLLGERARATAVTVQPPGFTPSHAMNAVDGDAVTTWRVAAGNGAALTMAPGPTLPQSVELHIRSETPLRLRQLNVSSNGKLLAMNAYPRCAHDSPLVNTYTCSVPLHGARVAAPLTVYVRTTSHQAVAVSEIEVNGERNEAPPASQPCRSDLVELDGEPVPVTLAGSARQLLIGEPVPFAFCTTLILQKGWHTLDAAPRAPISTVRLRTADGNSPIAALPLRTRLTSDSPTKIVVRTPGSRAYRLISGQAMSTQWSANAGGKGLGTAVELDTQAGWSVPANQGTKVTIEHDAQPSYRIALVISAIALLAAIAVAIIDPKSRRPRDRTRHYVNARLWLACLDLAVVAFAFGIGGLAQAIVALVALIACRRDWVTPKLVGYVALAVMAIAVVATVPPLGPALSPVNPAWPLVRETAHFAARQAAVLLAVAIAAFARGNTRRRTLEPVD